MLQQATYVGHPEGYIRYERGVALSRLALVAGFVALLAVFTPWRMAAFGALEFLLYLALLIATEIATRSADRLAASRRLRWQSEVLMVLLVANACGLAVQIRLYGRPIMQVEAALLAICVMMFAALRVHMSRISYVVGVAPPAVTLLWIAIDPHSPLLANHFALAMLLFVAAVVVATWRQQITDRALTRAVQDLTRSNLSLMEAKEAAERAAQAKTRLLAVASHEIRTPLNAVLGFAHALGRDRLAPAQADLARGVLEAGEQLRRLLDGILDLANAEEGTSRLNPAPTDLRALTQSTLRIWQGHAAALGVALRFDDADPHLPFDVVADGARFEQALVTLLSNALKVSPPAVGVHVRLAGARSGEALDVLVEVRDEGPPIPPEDTARIFDAFDQTARGRITGDSGLGLATCKAAVALMGGELGVASTAEAGEAGAVFWFTFQAEVCDRPAPQAAPEPATPASGRLRVLAAEDNAANRQVLATLLAAAPVDLVFAEDGVEALAAWRERAFDLVLMDVNMPRMDGVTALTEIRDAEPAGARTPIWMLTANVFEADIARYMASGADGVLRKPVEVAALFQVLEAAGRAADGVG